MSSGIGYSNKGLQTVCPTGIASFDQLIGGGFALTSINVIDEDQPRMFCSMLAKAYIASGMLAKQTILIFSPTITDKGCRFMRELPSRQISSETPQLDQPGEDSMKIAFRYTNLPSRYLKDSEADGGGGGRMDFGTYLDQSVVGDSLVEFYPHGRLLEVLREKVAGQGGNAARVVCRILVDGIGSPLCELPSSLLTTTLSQLKLMMRRLTSCVCLLTLPPPPPDYHHEPSDLLPESTRGHFHFQSDCALRLIAFDEQHDSENPYFEDYAGLLQLLRLPRLNSFEPYNPLDSTEFGLKLFSGKRYLTVDKLALPPDLGETVSRLTGTSSGESCAASASKVPSF